MNTLLHLGAGFFGWVVQTTWQGTILAVVILLTQRVLGRRLSPAWRHGLWLLLVARLVLPAAPQSAWSLFNLTRVPASQAWAERASVVGVSASGAVLPRIGAPEEFRSVKPSRIHGANVPDDGASFQTRPVPGGASGHFATLTTPDWYQVATWVWLLGAFVIAVRLCWSNFRFWLRIAAEPPVANEPARRQFEDCRATLGIRRAVDLIETEHVESPSVHGLVRIRVLLPKGIFDRFSSEELRCVFLHELAHVKRRDLEINWLASLLQAAHWFNPLLWFAFARMRIDREVACDALALAQLGRSPCVPYGETILKVVENLVRPPSVPGLLALSEDKRQLQERIRMIAGFRNRPAFSLVAAALVAGIAVVGLTDANQAPTPTAPTPGNATDATPTASEQRDAQPKGIRGRVVDAKGNPVADATVTCQGFDWQKSTDSEGRFVWQGANTAQQFMIHKTGFIRLGSGLLVPGAEETILRLQRLPSIRGRVIDRETRQPIPSFGVYRAALLQGPVSPTLMDDETVKGSSGEFKYCSDVLFRPDSALYIDAEGFRPVVSRPLSIADDGKELTFELSRAEPMAGKVLTPDGSPASQAEVRFWSGQIRSSSIPQRFRTNTDRDGAFSLPTGLDGEFVVRHESGYAEVPLKQFTATRTIQLVKWGKVRGHWPKPWPPHGRVWLHRIEWSGEMFALRPPWNVTPTRINSDGSFEFEESVPPGEYKLGEMAYVQKVTVSGGATAMIGLVSKRVPVLVEPGRTSVIELAAGRPVFGKLTFGDGQMVTNIQLPVVRLSLKQWSPVFNHPAYSHPANSPTLSDSSRFDGLRDYRERMLDYWLSDEGKARRRMERVLEVAAEPDGAFWIDHVPPGTYALEVNAEGFARVSGPQISREVVVPEGADTPLDLGTLR